MGSIVNSSRKEPIPFVSPLRYAGSKRRFSTYVAQTMLLNNLRPELYVEPFAGGASVALYLLQHDLVDRIGLIDADPLVSSFWKVIFDKAHSGWLLDQIDTIEVTIETWHAMKASKPRTIREKALKCLFLNRTSFSGLLTDNAGPIGGMSQGSPYKIDCRFNRSAIIDRIVQVANLSDRVAFVWSTDWLNGMRRLETKQIEGELPKRNVLFYFDPPYFEKAARLYRKHFDAAQHRQLRDFLLAFNDPWILSYDSAQKFQALYSDEQFENAEEIEHIYSLSISSNGGRPKATEVVLSNLPYLPSASCILKLHSR